MLELLAYTLPMEAYIDDEWREVMALMSMFDRRMPDDWLNEILLEGKVIYAPNGS